MSYAEVMAADAAVVHAEAGDAVIYWPTAGRDAGNGPGQTVATYAMSVVDSLVPGEADQRRTSQHELMISVPKATILGVSVLGDRVTFPGAWVGSGESLVTWRVAEVLKDRSSSGSWVLGMGR